MDRLDAMAAFVAAVDDGSLAAAARRLGRSPAGVTRAIAGLEERLGTALLRRTTRALHLTAFGETYLATCRRVLAELSVAEQGAAQEQERPRGLLTLTAPVLFGTRHLRPVVDSFLDAHPAVTVRLLLLDRVVGLVEEGIDAATRLAHLPDSSLIATRLGAVRRVVCAAPAYLERHGAPREPADLRTHACITTAAAALAEPWRFGSGPEDGRGGRLIPIRPRLSVNGSAAAIDSAIDGNGLTQVLSYQVENHLAAGRLALVLTGFEPPPIPVHLVYPDARTAPTRLRAFIAFAAPLLRERLAGSAAIAAAAEHRT